LIRFTRGLIPPLPGMNGPVNSRRMDELRLLLDTFQKAIVVDGIKETASARARMGAFLELFRELAAIVNDERMQEDAGPILSEIQSVVRMVALEVLEIRGTRAMRSVLRLETV
jgi:hypothetical protein